MRILVIVLLSFCAALASAATLKISTLYPPGSAPVKSLQAVAQTLKTETGGAVTLKVYPGGVMGDDSTVMRKIRIGQLHGALVSAATLESIRPDLKDLSVPFQFDRIDQVYTARETLDSAFRQRLAEEGWLGFGPLDGGFSYLMSKEPVNNLADIRASKLWLPNTKDIQAMTDALKVNYLVMNIGDVLTGLDTGAIDTLIAPPSAALTLNWHSRFNYYTETPVIYTWGMLVLPERALRKVPAQHREAVSEALSEWSVSLDAELREGNQSAKVAIGQLLEPQPFDLSDVRALRLTQR